MSSLTQCFLCRDCEGAAYGWPPILYTGRLDSPILVIAQNPGDFHSATDKERYQWQLDTASDFRSLKEQGMLETSFAQVTIEEAYRKDFGESTGAKQLARVFGTDWLEQCCYTNAVLCRTPNNVRPSNQMIENCRKWMLELIELHPRKLIVAVGAIAKNQIVPESSRRLRNKLNWGVPQQLRSGRYVLPILHYSAWRHHSIDPAPGYAVVFEDAVKALDIPYLFN